jgi:hypothetical protein
MSFLNAVPRLCGDDRSLSLVGPSSLRGPRAALVTIEASINVPCLMNSLRASSCRASSPDSRSIKPSFVYVPGTARSCCGQDLVLQRLPGKTQKAHPIEQGCFHRRVRHLLQNILPRNSPLCQSSIKKAQLTDRTLSHE